MFDKSAGHKGDHGPQDHGFVAGREAFVVANSAAVLADPGEGPLHYPATWQDLERVGVAHGDDLQVHLQGRGPGAQVAGIDGIGPDQADVAAAAVQVPQQRPGRVAVLHAGRGDHRGQQQAGGIHGDVPLAFVDLLGVIPTAARTRHGMGGADRLEVDHRGGRLGVPADGGPDLGAQHIMQPGQRTVVPPGAKYPYTVRQGGKSAGR